jgi:transketolase
VPAMTADPKQMANAIRALSMDAVQQANSGHPGAPMGMADIATVLFTQFLKYDPAAPDWPDRDRFVLSNGHGSMLLYSLLYLTGYEDVDIDQVRNFRSSAAVPRVTRNMATRAVSRPQPDHSAKALPTRSAWRSRSA